jgi:hypothetical protein
MLSPKPLKKGAQAKRDERQDATVTPNETKVPDHAMSALCRDIDFALHRRK